MCIAAGRRWLCGVALFSGGNLSPGEREDRANHWVIVAFALIGLLAAHLPAYTDRNGFCTLDGDAIRWLGVVLFAAGGALRIWPVFVLGRRFSGLVAIQPDCEAVYGRRAATGPSNDPPVVYVWCRLIFAKGSQGSGMVEERLGLEPFLRAPICVL